MWMRIMEYNLSISHVPGKQLHTVNVLSRKLSDKNNCKEESFFIKYQIFTVELLPASPTYRIKLRTELR